MGIRNGDTEKGREEKGFYPEYVFEIILFALIALELVMVFSMLYPQAAGREIDFQSQFQPKPEWYFLWLYQLVRYFPGKSAFIGTVLIPAAAVCLFVLIPFIHRGRHGRLKAYITAGFLIAAFAIFTLIPSFNP